MKTEDKDTTKLTTEKTYVGPDDVKWRDILKNELKQKDARIEELEHRVEEWVHSSRVEREDRLKLQDELVHSREMLDCERKSAIDWNAAWKEKAQECDALEVKLINLTHERDHAWQTHNEFLNVPYFQRGEELHRLRAQIAASIERERKFIVALKIIGVGAADLEGYDHSLARYARGTLAKIAKEEE